MKSEQAIERNWGIDSLRVLCMFMIVIWHILWRGGVLANVSVPSLQYDIAWLLAMLAFGAVNCYGLISGYVGVRSRFKLSNLVELWMRGREWNSQFHFSSGKCFPNPVAFPSPQC